jgi:hypothetical protein
MLIKSRNHEIKKLLKMRIVMMQLTCDHHVKCMTISSFWYASCRHPKELCKVLLGWCVGFYMLLVCFELLSRSVEVLAKIQSL